MRVLTDDTVLAGPFVPDGRRERWQRHEQLSPSDRQLVDALGLATVWGQEVQSDAPFWSTVLILSHAEGSQFDALERLLGSGRACAGPIASLALSGSRFHGQRGRAWAAVPGNLHVSIAVPAHVDAEHVGVGLSMLPAVAALDAITETSGGAIQPAVKWVNDIVIGDSKVGGVLTTAHTTRRRIDDVIWGIGINVDVAPDIVPTPFVPATTCLRAQPGGERVTLPCLFWALADAIAMRYRDLVRFGPPALFAAYCRHSLVVGRAVTVWEEGACIDADPARWGPPLAKGVVADIAGDLSLRLEGQRDVVSKGRLAMSVRSL